LRLTVPRRSRLRRRGSLRKLAVGITATLSTAALAACGGGEDESAATNLPANLTPANQAPSISGTPSAQAMQDQQYTFTPAASDANGDTLTFSIAGVPAGWTFDSSNGRLAGTPTSAQTGIIFPNIRISVSDGTATTNLAAFSITIVATSTGSAMLTWNPPTQNADGSPLTDLAGYRVYWGTSQGNYSNSTTINNPGLSSYVVEQLTPATWHFALTAINSAGAESVRSNVASKQVL
jgi:hypothetical protein